MVMLPDGWELDEDGNPRPRRKRYRLSDLVIDEVSCVKSGANQRAHIVLVKSDDGQPDPDRVVLFKSDLNRFILEHEMPEDALPLYSPPNRYPDAKRVGAFYESHPASYERRLGRYPVSGFAKGDDMTERERQELARTIESPSIPGPKRVQQLPTMRVPEKVSDSFVAGRPEPAELTKAQMIAKGLNEYPSIYDL